MLHFPVPQKEGQNFVQLQQLPGTWLWLKLGPTGISGFHVCRTGFVYPDYAAEAAQTTELITNPCSAERLCISAIYTILGVRATE